jgi:phosphoribosyl-AMP cyclohydrolase
MPCYSPITGWRRRTPNAATGKYSITFDKSEAWADKEVTIPCGQCIGCRLEHSRQWAVRCVHESKMHKDNCFLTLTYKDSEIPTLGGFPTLHKPDLQKFMKRLRRHHEREMLKKGLEPTPIKFYGCGEYGEKTNRPHYHICIFGYDFHDRAYHTTTNQEHKLYTSRTLEKLWTKGHALIGEMTFQTAAYTARYCMKKRKGKDWKQFYERINPTTGEIVEIQPEFAHMSRRPGIGRTFLEKYKEQILANDFIIMNGMEMKPPKYYDNALGDLVEKNKALRRKAQKENSHESSWTRLRQREKVKKQQINQLKKEL